MDPADQEWHWKWTAGWALVATFLVTMAVASAVGARKPKVNFRTHANVSFETALNTLVYGDDLSQRLSAQAILLERMQAVVKALRSPRTPHEAEAAEAILRHIHEDTK